MSTETFGDRFLWLLLGCIIGLAAGWFTRMWYEVQRARKEAHTALEKVEEMERDKSDRGAASFQSIALVIVIALTAFAAFQSQRSANRSNDALDQVQQTQMVLQRTQQCTENYVSGTLTALTERTTFSRAQADANVNLQKSQAELIFTFLNPPDAGDVDSGTREALQKYFTALQEYNGIVAKAQEKVANFPYPDPKEYRACIANNTEGNSDE